MDHFTVRFLLAHNTNLGFVFRRGQYQELLPTTRFTHDQLNQMTTYTLPRQQYTYLFAMAHEFRTLQDIGNYVNNYN
jgi:hypothetical protein